MKKGKHNKCFAKITVVTGGMDYFLSICFILLFY